ncbi:hypothetical protein CLV95_11817 [Leptospira borgpetersenii serovar Javanica]|nr:hypothetical protein CLV95_11817 [Leptospira borgpetersenii serovar Javanica]
MIHAIPINKTAFYSGYPKNTLSLFKTQIPIILRYLEITSNLYKIEYRKFHYKTLLQRKILVLYYGVLE